MSNEYKFYVWRPALLYVQGLRITYFVAVIYSFVITTETATKQIDMRFDMRATNKVLVTRNNDLRECYCDLFRVQTHLLAPISLLALNINIKLMLI